MTEKEYDEQIAPALLDLANKVQALGGSFVARVEWAPDKAGTTAAGMKDAGVGQKLTHYAALSHGNLDKLYFTLAKHGDLSQTIVGMAMGWKPREASYEKGGSTDAAQ